MFKIHSKFNKGIKDFFFYGKREEISLRISRGLLEKGDIDEKLHYHKNSTQYFLIVKGIIKLLLDNKEELFIEDNVYEISPMTKYRILSCESNECDWIVIGTVNDPEDRVEID